MKVATIRKDGKEIAEIIMEEGFLSAAMMNAGKSAASASDIRKNHRETDVYHSMPERSLIINGAI